MKSGATEHPKILDLADWVDTATNGGFSNLGVDPVSWAAGAMEKLWQWAAKYAPAGDVGRFSDARIADAMGWRREATPLVEALVRIRLLDVSEACRLAIHNWAKHCEDSVHARLARAKKRFADGAAPKTSKLERAEREEADRFFASTAPVGSIPEPSGDRRQPPAAGGALPGPMPLPKPLASSKGRGFTEEPSAQESAPPCESSKVVEFVPSTATECDRQAPADVPADPEAAPDGVAPDDWRRACTMAALIEQEPHETAARGQGRALRPLAIVYAAERLQGGWDTVEPVILGILAKHREDGALSRILGDLRNWPDGAYPGNGKSAAPSKSPPSRLEQAATILRGLGWATFRQPRKRSAVRQDNWVGTG